MMIFIKPTKVLLMKNWGCQEKAKIGTTFGNRQLIPIMSKRELMSMLFDTAAHDDILKCIFSSTKYLYLVVSCISSKWMEISYDKGNKDIQNLKSMSKFSGEKNLTLDDVHFAVNKTNWLRSITKVKTFFRSVAKQPT